VSLPPFFLAFETFSLTSRMRATFMSALDELSAHAKPFRAGVRERCSMHSAALFLPMFCAYTAVSFSMLWFFCLLAVLIVILAASLAVFCTLLQAGTIAVDKPADDNIRGLLVYALLGFSRDNACPAYGSALSDVARGVFASVALALVFFVLLYPDYFRICRTSADSTRAACIGQHPGDHVGRLTVVRPAAAGLRLPLS